MIDSESSMADSPEAVLSAEVPPLIHLLRDYVINRECLLCFSIAPFQGALIRVNIGIPNFETSIDVGSKEGMLLEPSCTHTTSIRW
jgi:hypothetical protein